MLENKEIARMSAQKRANKTREYQYLFSASVNGRRCWFFTSELGDYFDYSKAEIIKPQGGFSLYTFSNVI